MCVLLVAFPSSFVFLSRNKKGKKNQKAKQNRTEHWPRGPMEKLASILLWKKAHLGRKSRSSWPTAQGLQRSKCMGRAAGALPKDQAVALHGFVWMQSKSATGALRSKLSIRPGPCAYGRSVQSLLDGEKSREPPPSASPDRASAM